MNLTMQQKQSFNLSDLNKSDVLRFKRDIPVKNLPIIRAGITIVWLEDSQHSSSVGNNVQLHTLLQNDRCSVVFYSNVAKCIKYLKRTRSPEYVIVIIISYSIDVMHKIIYRLRRYRMVQTIFIVSSDRNASDCFSSTTDDIVVFQNENSMLDRLDHLIVGIQKNNFEGGLFTTFNRKEKALKNIREELSAFLWNHTFKVLVISMPCDSLEAKQQMLTECRVYYRKNVAQLSQIDEFENTYKPSDAIRWYTKPCFLFSLVNKALHSGDMLTLYTFRYFITGLCNRLEEMSAAHSDTSFQLYRGAKIHRDEVASLQIGSLIANNGFFSCSRDRKVAEMFISIDPSTGTSPSRSRDEKQQFVLFEVDVDLMKFPDTVVTDMSTQSECPSENELVFMIGSTFNIDKISYEPEKYLWVIQISSHPDIAQNRSKHERYTRQRLQETSSVVLFGNVFANIESDYMHLLEYFHHLLRILPINHIDRPDVYYNLGRIYRLLEKYEKALACFQCAQLLLCRLLPQRMFDYCRALGGVGTIYSILGNSKRAINILEKTMNLQSRHLPDNHTEIPFHLNRLGNAYFKDKQFERALSILYDDDDFFQKRMPIEHQGHAQTFHILGLVYRALGDEEKAYNHFNQSLQKRDLLLAKDHPSVACTCYKLSLMHEDRGEYELALEYAERSLRIQSSKLPYYHSESRQSIELVERLRQRQQVCHTSSAPSNIVRGLICSNRIKDNSLR